MFGPIPTNAFTNGANLDWSFFFLITQLPDNVTGFTGSILFNLSFMQFPFNKATLHCSLKAYSNLQTLF